MNANIDFSELSDIISKVDNISLTSIELNHPGGCGGLKIKDADGKIAVFIVDHEHGNSIDSKYIDFCKGANILIHDTQYTDEELKKYIGWGHSSFSQAIELAQLSNTEQLIMTHNDPEHSDQFLLNEETKCQERFTNCKLAKEGLSLEV